MPVYAFLEYHEIPCPHCGATLPSGSARDPCYITFRWGYCPSRSPNEIIYRVGDSVYWRPCRDGVVRGWTSFDGGHRSNVGDPTLNTVIVTDWGSDVAHFPTACPACRQSIGSAALHIECNLITSAWAFAPGKLIEAAPAGVRDHGSSVQIPEGQADTWWAADYYLALGDGTWEPVPAWEDRGFDYIDS